jgi:hypothetical protein
MWRRSGRSAVAATALCTDDSRLLTNQRNYIAWMARRKSGDKRRRPWARVVACLPNPAQKNTGTGVSRSDARRKFVIALS